MPTRTFTPLLGKRIRVTVLDDCGNFPAASAPDSLIVTDGFITLSLSAEVEDGAEIITKKADGSLCVNEKFSDSFKRFTMEIEFCGVNPALVSMVSVAEPYEGYTEGDIIGFRVPEGAIEKQFGFELWTGLAGAACAPGAESAGGYLLLPFVQGGVPGDIEVTSEDAVNFTLTGAYTKGGNQWGVGPYDVLFNPLPAPGAAAPLPTPLDPFDHLLMVETSVAPPPSADEPQPFPT